MQLCHCACKHPDATTYGLQAPTHAIQLFRQQMGDRSSRPKMLSEPLPHSVDMLLLPAACCHSRHPEVLPTLFSIQTIRFICTRLGLPFQYFDPAGAGTFPNSPQEYHASRYGSVAAMEHIPYSYRYANLHSPGGWSSLPPCEVADMQVEMLHEE
jgi:hypothetical protein